GSAAGCPGPRRDGRALDVSLVLGRAAVLAHPRARGLHPRRRVGRPRRFSPGDRSGPETARSEQRDTLFQERPARQAVTRSLPSRHARLLRPGDPSTPQPDCTATYCLPSTAKELGTPVTPELVVNSHSTAPVFASKARNFRSFVPPEKTRPPPVVSTGPQFCHLNACVHTFWPVFMFQACTSPMLVAPGRRLR